MLSSIEDSSSSVIESSPKSQRSEKPRKKNSDAGGGKENRSEKAKKSTLARVPSVMKAADHAVIPNVPIILFMGKTI